MCLYTTRLSHLRPSGKEGTAASAHLTLTNRKASLCHLRSAVADGERRNIEYNNAIERYLVYIEVSFMISSNTEKETTGNKKEGRKAVLRHMRSAIGAKGALMNFLSKSCWSIFNLQLD